ncbi:hypothetical protein [Xanthomonas nasturtii]|uniref:Uncharacterized protein n=1 Tax=Xanthomonas nasturtii TaxID=1843581 RepID=A0ABT0LSI0_9XANT|nr:hypothetical protein [Xanthomonas nasturtii]MCL1526094.1 hypothetical protein [Xanthomonas nasturtii]MCL1535673.1 hypothetical protein [Xanthomonas nasturtii]MCL1543324.1 hypothetical protein [Xanthomonas nasturtii]MCL1552306.1 hypothetical protein [Xanthomonas nasturtii]MCL1556535.1 hypothetical protein [Xanthomonas nasturtii]
MSDWLSTLPDVGLGVIIAALSSFFLGALSGVFLQHRSSAKRAAEVFRGTLLEAFSGMYPTPSNWPSNIDTRLRDVYPKLEQAVEAFRPHLPWWKKRSFERAWFIYRLGKDGREIDVQVYHQYMGFEEQGQLFIDPKVRFKTNVHNLVAFAKKA